MAFAFGDGDEEVVTLGRLHIKVVGAFASPDAAGEDFIPFVLCSVAHRVFLPVFFKCKKKFDKRKTSRQVDTLS
jgi:hypothetical protein